MWPRRETPVRKYAHPPRVRGRKIAAYRFGRLWCTNTHTHTQRDSAVHNWRRLGIADGGGRGGGSGRPVAHMLHAVACGSDDDVLVVVSGSDILDVAFDDGVFDVDDWKFSQSIWRVLWLR